MKQVAFALATIVYGAVMFTCGAVYFTGKLISNTFKKG